MKPVKEAEGYLDDLQGAYDYYRTYSAKAANDFLVAYEKAYLALVNRPHFCRVRRHGWRQMIIPRYPNYSVFYKELPDFWLLAGVVPTARYPDAIQARLLIREVGEEPEK